MQAAANVIKTAVTKLLGNRSLGNNKSADEALVQLRGEAPDLNLGNNILSVVSYVAAKALAYSKELPLYKCKFLPCYSISCFIYPEEYNHFW